VAFRRRYFTSRTTLQRSLGVFMQSYNHERPHQGIASVAAPQPRSSGAPLGHDFLPHYGMVNVARTIPGLHSLAE